MPECTPIPCPSWETVKLEVLAICTCQATWGFWGNGFGDLNCPVHGDQVREMIDLYDAAFSGGTDETV